MAEDPMELWIQDFLDQQDVKIVGALFEMAVDLQDKAYNRGDPPALQLQLMEHRSVAERRLIAIERFYQSNPPEARRLAHVRIQRTRLADGRELGGLMLESGPT